jgi:uncharacterized protein (TIGR02246 family)
MRRHVVVFLVLLLGTAAARADPRTEIDAIRALGAKWVEAIKAKEVAWIAERYAEDGRLMAPGMPVAEGREAIRAAWTTMVDAPGPPVTFAPTQIHLAGSLDHAYEIGTWRTGEVDEGSYVLIWKKRGDAWHVMADIFNSTRTPPADGATAP